ncbi:MAG: helix-turn-helix domain-containing protein [Acidimicrobiaceae bacterium]|nr:helix-turn-helix domain-containing protein [Acidimicrobiia bacterium]MCY4493917.1 helix-turn-helix domain-containing protein [Acidimicrobiaceae bacterium]
MPEFFLPFNTVKGLGDELRRLRMDAALTQSELASKAGVSRRWVGNAEKGHVGGEIGKLMMVVRALGVKLAFERDPWAE